jgi:putative phosphoribosyl transferase
METQFRNRHEAGKFLAKKLRNLMNNSDLIVLALPRGGVPVAYQIARELDAPLDVFIVRKLGVPIQEELV